MRTLVSLLFASGMVTAATQAMGIEPNADRFEIEAAISRESLTRGLPDWTSNQLIIERHRWDRQLLFVGLRQTERYALKDSELSFGGIQPITTNWQLQFEAGVSNTHRVLASRYALLGAHFTPAAGWGISGNWRQSTYPESNTHVASLAVERYLGAERFAYTLFSGGPEGTSASASHRLQWTHYYGDRDSIGVALVNGWETEYAGNGAFLTARVRGLSLTGRHEISPPMTVIWEAGKHQQGDFHTRSGVRVGLRYRY